MLTVADLSVQYGATRVIRDLRLTVGSGMAVALLGANGAGKSTTLQAIAGMIRPVRGSIQVNGEEISTYPLHRVVKRGLAFVPEERMVVAPLTVAENLELSALAGRERVDSRREEVFAIFPEVVALRGRRAGSLDTMQRLMLALGRAVMTRPTMILVDQPCRGLDGTQGERIYAGLAQIRDLGYALLLSDQNIALALGLCEYGYVMRHGALVAHGKPEALNNSDEIADAYLG